MEGIRVRFGGNMALDDVSLTIAEGAIVGLIGPNGAGKSTAINVLSGVVNPARGRVLVDGRDVTRRSVQVRAGLGIGRTFQQVQLCEESTIEENLIYAAEALLSGCNPLRMVVGRRGESNRISERVAEALEMTGLGDVAKAKVQNLSTGQRRLAEVARCIVNEYRIVLLDEPAAGLDEHETEEIGRLLEMLARERGLGVLLVEHDMTLVLGICESLFVLDFGRVIFSGSSSDAKSAAVVQDAYLGVL